MSRILLLEDDTMIASGILYALEQKVMKQIMPQV